MSSSRLSLIGLYNYDPTIFDNLTLPTGLTKDILTNNILMRGAEFEVLYPDADFIKFSIGAWSAKWQATFQRWVDALAIEYAPLENYNRIEDWSDSDQGTEAKSELGERTGSGSGSTSGRTNSTTKHKVSADDAGDTLTMKDQDELVGADSSSSSTSSNEKSSGASSGEYAKDAEHHGIIHGNIGVTTSQQMLLSELDLGYWNIYEKITDLFLTEFVIPVY